MPNLLLCISCRDRRYKTNIHHSERVMSEFNLSVIVTAFAIGIHLLMQFNQDISVPKWLAPFGLGGLLAILIVILPWIQKGSFLAFVAGYLAMGFLVINLVILFTLAHLPGQAVKLSSASSRKAGMILIKLLGAGLIVLSKSILESVVWGIAQVKTWISCHSKQGTGSQKLLESGGIVCG
jgi:hypothetical protein